MSIFSKERGEALEEGSNTKTSPFNHVIIFSCHYFPICYHVSTPSIVTHVSTLPVVQQEKVLQIATCFKCGSKGHISSACPSCHVNTILPNDNYEDDDEVGDVEIEMKIEYTKKETVEATVTDDAKGNA